MIQTFDLSVNEKKIIDTLRTMKPYEMIQIVADAQGRPDSFLLTKSTKVLLVLNKEAIPIKAKFTLQD